jgi:hypothetical protein
MHTYINTYIYAYIHTNRGPLGSFVSIKLKRTEGGVTTDMDVQVERRKIQVPKAAGPSVPNGGANHIKND